VSPPPVPPNWRNRRSPRDYSVNAGASLAGAFELTDRDIAVRVVAENESGNQPVERFMTPDVVVCRSDDDLSVAQDLMGEMQVARIVCVNEDGELDGVISLSDIAQVSDAADAMATLRSVTVREARI
jgi:signal-transduction protein with cAMP-binding, CBS, and nucleotidyltransferase domain